MLRVYLDNCCLNRPFDVSDQDRIKLEVEAIRAIVRMLKRGELIWVTSSVLESELAANPDKSRAARIHRFFDLPFERVDFDRSDAERAAELNLFGVKGIDAFHLAAAERGKCDAFLTTDDRLIAAVRKAGKEIRLAVSSLTHSRDQT